MYNVKLEKSYFPATGGDLPPAMTIGGLLALKAKSIPDNVALHELDFDGEIQRNWTYKQLNEAAIELAYVLADRHEKGARIAVWAPNIPEWILLELASSIAGLVLVTVNPSYQARELKYVLEQSRSEAIYYVADFRGNPMQEIADQVCDEIPAVKHRINMQDKDQFWGGSKAEKLPEVKPSDVCQIQYTSGTTGFPKGALLHHHGLVQNASDTLEREGIVEGELMLHNMPLFHTTGCAVVLLGALSKGATLFLAPIFDPEVLLKVIEREKIQFLLGVPTMIVAFIEEAKRSGRDVSSIKAVASGGAMVAPELAKESKEIFGTYIQIVYGQTECSPVISLCWGDDSLEDMTETIGQPLPYMDAAILNPQTNEVMELGEQGEICVRGYHVMDGYNDNPEATAQAIDKDGWLHTGDLGRMDERGYISITGRVKEMIIRGGENIFPVEIENAMTEHSDIMEVAVIGVPDKKWGELICCYMRASGEGRPSDEELKAFVRERLSPQKTPTFWRWVDEWPLTGSGKIQKFKLVEMFEKENA